jgi:hypothetical protein
MLRLLNVTLALTQYIFVVSMLLGLKVMKVFEFHAEDRGLKFTFSFQYMTCDTFFPQNFVLFFFFILFNKVIVACMVSCEL